MSLRSLATGVALALVGTTLAAHAFETTAREALVIDDGTGMVLFDKDADKPIPPASMSKLMTLYMLFEALRDGRVTMDDRVRRQPARPVDGRLADVRRGRHPGAGRGD